VSSLANTLIEKLHTEFAGTEMLIPGRDGAVVTFPAKHSEVGDVSVLDDGDELTLLLGNFTHIHFGNYERELSEEKRAVQISEEVVEFLRKVFSDQIEFYGTGRGGGCRQRGLPRRGAISQLFLGSKTYVWSGPLDAGEA
jgi:hypothetical protein